MASNSTDTVDVPEGYYKNKDGLLRKKGPASERTEFGHHYILLTEAELQHIRRSIMFNRQKVFGNEPSRTKARVWISPSELVSLNELRKTTNRPLVVQQKRTIENKAKMNRAETADRRRKMLEWLRLSGQSTRTTKAKLDLFVTEHIMVDGDDGFMDLELFDALELPREWLPLKK